MQGLDEPINENGHPIFCKFHLTKMKKMQGAEKRKKYINRKTAIQIHFYRWGLVSKPIGPTIGVASIGFHIFVHKLFLWASK